MAADLVQEREIPASPLATREMSRRVEGDVKSSRRRALPPEAVDRLRSVAHEAAATSSQEGLSALVSAIEEVLSGASSKDARLAEFFSGLSEDQKISFRSKGEQTAHAIGAYAEKTTLSPRDQEKIFSLITNWLMAGGVEKAFAIQHAVISLQNLTTLLEGSYTDRRTALA